MKSQIWKYTQQKNFMKETTRMTMTHIIKINEKIFTIDNTPTDRNWELTCPDNQHCYVDMTAKKVFHRDIEGKVQVEPILNF